MKTETDWQCRICGQYTDAPEPGVNHVCKDGNEVDPGWCIDFVPHVRRAAAYATMLQTLKDARDVLVVDARRLLPRGLAWDASAKLISQINEAIRKGDESDES